jgi:multiple antibiotic resistance protein
LTGIEKDFVGLGEAVVTLFIVLDPFTVVPFYVSAAEKLPPERRGGFLNTLIYSAVFMLLAFIVIGDYLFELLGVTLKDFRIAAGLILLVYAISSLFDIEIGAPSSSESVERQAIVPLATPLLAGPGSISTALYFRYIYGYPIAIGSVLVNAALAYVILYFGDRLMRLLGKHGALLIDKFMSLVLAGFAVSLIRASL